MFTDQTINLFYLLLELVSGSKDLSIGIVDMSGKLSCHLKNAHTLLLLLLLFCFIKIRFDFRDPINVVNFLNEEVVASGDDEGEIKVIF